MLTIWLPLVNVAVRIATFGNVAFTSNLAVTWQRRRHYIISAMLRFTSLSVNMSVVTLLLISNEVAQLTESPLVIVLLLLLLYMKQDMHNLRAKFCNKHVYFNQIGAVGCVQVVEPNT